MKDKVRDSRFELLRLIAILIIVLSHFSLYGQEQRLLLNPNIWERIGADLFTSLGKVGVSIFVLISGYFIGNKQITVLSAIQRGWKVWIETVFYSIVLFVAFTFSSKSFQPVLFVKSIIPVTTNLYWFVTAYIILIFFLPILNESIINSSKRQFQYLIVINIVLNFMIPILPGNIELLVLLPYLIGAYIKKYGVKIEHKGMYLAAMLFISESLMILLKTLGHGSSVVAIGIIPTVTAVLLFLIVLGSKPFHSTLINKIATTSFAGYLVTEFPLMRTFLWEQLLSFSNVKSALIADIIGLFAIIIILYVGVVSIDLIRQKLFQIMGIDSVPQRVFDSLKKSTRLSNLYYRLVKSLE